MVRAIVGYSGFVGSNLLQFYKFDYFYNSKNFSEAIEKEFDEMFFCGVPAVKWIANKFPLEDENTLTNIKNILQSIKVNKIILISTIDIYENTDNPNLNEDYCPNYIENHTYGKNRYLFETFITSQFENYHIVRLPALFGKGLKKNIIFDLMNNNQIENISKYTSFQWYCLDWLKCDIDRIIQNNIKICNLFTEPVDTIAILNLFNYDIDKFKNNSTLKYNLSTKYFNETQNYLYSKKYVLEHMQKFIAFNNINKNNLVVSNICIKNTISQFQFANILKLFGIKYVQIAPTTIIDNWYNIDKFDESYENNFLNNGISLYSFQSITFGLNDLNIFNESTQTELFNHLKKIINLAIKHSVKILVFGCPRNRKILCHEPYENNCAIFCDFFKKLGDYIGNNDLTICIEPNSKQYGCNFINTVHDGANIVRQINNNNIKLMVDIGNMLMEDETIEVITKNMDIIYNIDISNKFMKSFYDKLTIHSQFVNLLKSNDYCKKMNLEMVITDECPENCLFELRTSLANFIEL